jgi:uncharacterized membrane protein YfcA
VISKILNSKITKITAIILLPTVLVGSYYGVKWIIKKKKELDLKKKQENNNTLKDENV